MNFVQLYLVYLLLRFSGIIIKYLAFGLAIGAALIYFAVYILRRLTWYPFVYVAGYRPVHRPGRRTYYRRYEPLRLGGFAVYEMHTTQQQGQPPKTKRRKIGHHGGISIYPYHGVLLLALAKFVSLPDPGQAMVASIWDARWWIFTITTINLAAAGFALSAKPLVKLQRWLLRQRELFYSIFDRAFASAIQPYLSEDLRDSRNC